MSLNTTHGTGPANSSLSYQAANPISAQDRSQVIDPTNNLGYGMGRIVRSAFDHLWHTWHKMWAVEPTSEELALLRHDMIFRNGLRECVQRLDAALDHVLKNPHDLGTLKKIESLAEAPYLKSQEKPELRALQHKALQPLEEKISQLDPQIKNTLKQFLPVMFQEKSPVATSKDTGPLPLANSRIGKTKRAVQQTGAFPASFDLLTLMGTDGFKIEGLAAGNYLGNSVSTAGDLNGDGNADLVLGARQASPGGRSSAGTAYVVFGQASGWPGAFDLTTLNGTNGFKIEGLAAGDELGWSVSTAGDLNGDGKADLVLGASTASPGGRSTAGTAYVVFGQASGWSGVFDLTTLNGINGFKVEGLAVNDQLGSSVSTAGDLNGDGKADLVLGAPLASPGGRTQAGAAYVVFGKASGWPGAFNLTTLNGINGFKVDGLIAADSLGVSVSTAGDLNGDGKADLVLGAWEASPGGRTNAGTAYVLFGQVSGWPGAFNLTTLDGINGFKVDGLAAFDRLGFSASTSGDVNGDGKADLVLGARDASPGGPGGRASAGAAYVVFGQASGWPGAFDLTTLNGINGFKVEGLVTNDFLGYSVSTAGDVNGDGKADLVLGAEGADPGGRNVAGAAYVVFGQTSGWPGAFNLTTLNGTNGFKVDGLAIGDLLGSSVSTAGDLNGDGKADFMLGAQLASPGGRTNAGTAYVIFGRNTSLAPTPSTATPTLSSTSGPSSGFTSSALPSTVTPTLSPTSGPSLGFTSSALPSTATPTLSPTSGPSSGFTSSALPSTAAPTLSPTSGPSSGFTSSTPSSIATQGPTSSLTSGISPTPMTSTSKVPTPTNGVGGPTPSRETIGIAAGVLVLGGLAGLYD